MAIFGLQLSTFAQQAAYAPLEVQCKSPNQELDIVIKRSPDTNQAYALLLSSERLETYGMLQKEEILEESSSFFHYQNQNEFVKIDLLTGRGTFQMGWHHFESYPLELKQCVSTAGAEAPPENSEI